VSGRIPLLLAAAVVLAGSSLPGCRLDGSKDEGVLVPLEETAEHRALAAWVRGKTRYADVRIGQTQAVVLKLMGTPNLRYRGGKGEQSWAWWPTDGEGRVEIHFGPYGRVTRKRFGLSWAFR
jgi:hypothetical protein